MIPTDRTGGVEAVISNALIGYGEWVVFGQVVYNNVDEDQGDNGSEVRGFKYPRANGFQVHSCSHSVLRN